MMMFQLDQFALSSDARPLALSLPPRSGGEGRPPKAVGVGGSRRARDVPPTPDPSPPLASLVGGGEKGTARMAKLSQSVEQA